MRYFRILPVLGCLISTLALADMAKLEQEFVQMKKQSDTYVEENRYRIESTPQQYDPEMRQRVESLRQSVIEKPELQKVIPPVSRYEPCPEQVMYMFFTLGMDESELKALFQTAYHYEDMPLHLMLRGIPPGMALDEALLMINKIAADYNDKINIEINPKAFRQFGVSSVPTLVWGNTPSRGGLHCEYAEYAKVIGINDPSYLSKTRAHLAPRNFGVKGPTDEIAEPDLLAQMHAKIMSIDWETKKKQALANYWKNYDFPELTPARSSRTRIVDAQVVATQDIKDHQGNVLVKAGETREPLSVLSWRSDLIVFDATKSEQVDWAEVEVRARAGTRPIVIASKIDEVDGFKQLYALSERFGQPVYALVPELVTTFQLEYVPAVVTAKHMDYVVMEFIPDTHSEKVRQGS